MDNNSKNWHMGRAIRRARRMRDLTQTELAVRIGLSRPWISVIENGRCDVSRHVVRIASALDVPITSLVSEARS